MALLEFVFMLLLQAEGISGGIDQITGIYLYNNPGDEVDLPCNSQPSSFSCSSVFWFYHRDTNVAQEDQVIRGNINKKSARASRLSVNSDCSLIIKDITEEDVGRYVCRPENNPDLDREVYLNILTISPSPPDDDLQEDEVTLTCSLRRYSNIGLCNQNSIRWFGDGGTELLGEGDGFEVRGQTDCVSILTVKHHLDHNRRFTCRFVEGNSVKIEAHYPPDPKGIRGGRISLYNKPGDEVVLPCNSKPSSSSCSSVNWFYKREEGPGSKFEVQRGIVNKKSTRASRLSVNSDCSLTIINITEEDVGRYSCKDDNGRDLDSDVYLNILTISPSPPDDDLQEDEVTLTCSLRRYSNIGFCNQNSIRWFGDGGTELLGEGDGFEVRGQTDCVSILTVKHQSDHNRRFTCRFVEGNSVKIEAHYPPDPPGISGGRIFLYNKPGDEVVLPCNGKPSSSSCSSVSWIYKREEEIKAISEVLRGNVEPNSARAFRLSVNSDCSLIINNITEEDVGRYACKPDGIKSFYTRVYLNVLTISPSPPDDDPQEDEVTLTCSLFRYWHKEMSACNQNSIRWFGDGGTELLGEGDGFEVRGQTDCVSILTVKHHLDHNRRFTCRFVEGNSVKIEAHYPPDPKVLNPLDRESQQKLIIIIIGAVLGVLVLLVFIIAVVIIKYRRSRETEDRRTTNYQTPTDQDDENYVTYATVDHSHPNVSSERKVKEEEEAVTYSAVRTKAKAEVDDDPSSYYS